MYTSIQNGWLKGATLSKIPFWDRLEAPKGCLVFAFYRQPFCIYIYIYIYICMYFVYWLNDFEHIRKMPISFCFNFCRGKLIPIHLVVVGSYSLEPWVIFAFVVPCLENCLQHYWQSPANSFKGDTLPLRVSIKQHQGQFYILY